MRAEPALIPTRLGGVFFLINLMRALDLPDGLARHFGIASRLGAWGWLEVLARGLIGARQPEFADDPVWSVVAGLEGRDIRLPLGRDFVGAASYRLPGAWVRSEDAGYAALSSLDALPLVPGVGSPGLESFLAFLLPYLAWRLRAALALEDKSPETLVDALLVRTARLSLTRSHVDVVMDLDQVSVPVRFAGLDVDPGWVPAFGRVVRFQFA